MPRRSEGSIFAGFDVGHPYQAGFQDVIKARTKEGLLETE